MNRIKILRQEFGYTQQDLANKLNGAKSTIAMYENESRKPSMKILVKLSEIFNCSIDYLLFKTDVRYPNQQTNSNLNSKIEISKEHIYLCPLYEKISASKPNWEEDCLSGYLPINSNLMNIPNPDEFYFFKISDQSMNKIIKKGAFALIKKVSSVKNGEIAVILINNCDAILTKFNTKNNSILLEPISNDNNIKTRIYDKDTNIKIIGKYIGKIEFSN